MGIFHLPDPFTAALSPVTAAAASSVLTLSYVGGLYVSTRTRVGRSQKEGAALISRDDAAVVKARMKTASVVSLASLAAAGAILNNGGAFHGQHPLIATFSTLRALGMPLPVPSLLHSNTLPFTPSVTLFSLHHVLPAVLSPLLLTSTLFLGPLYVCFLDQELPGQRMFNYSTMVRARWDNVWGLRNYVVGPLTEEVVFRACILSLHYFAGIKNKALLVFATPVYFGVAHLHHAYEAYVESGRTKEGLKRGLLRAAVQFAYTSIFGWYANFLFLRSGTIVAPLVAHVFCNIAGLPAPAQAAERFERRKWAIYATHALGIVAFGYNLFRWTVPGLYGGSLFWS